MGLGLTDHHQYFILQLRLSLTTAQSWPLIYNFLWLIYWFGEYWFYLFWAAPMRLKYYLRDKTFPVGEVFECIRIYATIDIISIQFY